MRGGDDALLDSNQLFWLAMQFQEVIVDCLAYVTPANTASEQITDVYRRKAAEMVSLIRDVLPGLTNYYVSHGMQVAQQMLMNTWDDAMFHELLGTNLDYLGEDTIDCATLNSCLEYIQVDGRSIMCYEDGTISFFPG